MKICFRFWIKLLIYEPVELSFCVFQLDVKKAKPVKDHPQWQISDDEDETKNDENDDDSDYDSSSDEED